MAKNIKLLYGFAFFDPFMIHIPVWVLYLSTQGITMRQFMELQAVFALVILCGEVPSGLLSDLWGRKKTLLLGSTLKALSFSLLPLCSSYEFWGTRSSRSKSGRRRARWWEARSSRCPMGICCGRTRS